jgi:RimJ/RimL family protein N-acetyltransferase
MTNSESLENSCNFATEIIRVESWQTYASSGTSDETSAQKALPPGWQNVDTVKKAHECLKERSEDCALFVYQYIPENLLIGFLFLNEASTSDSKSIDIRLGYLLSQENWGKGLGSELIKGLVELA